jgi:hypothetical protein
MYSRIHVSLRCPLMSYVITLPNQCLSGVSSKLKKNGSCPHNIKYVRLFTTRVASSFVQKISVKKIHPLEEESMRVAVW